MEQRSYRSSPWFHPHIALGASAIHGQGLFAIAPIRADELIFIDGGLVLTQAELDAGKLPPGEWSFDMIDEGLFIFSPQSGMGYFVNHSCDPNLWMADEVTMAARRDIQTGEELGLDYAMIQTRSSYRLNPCRCGSSLCRGTITGDDWLLPAVQARYRGHFIPYIGRRIARLNGEA